MIEYVGILITPRAISTGIAEALIADLVEITAMEVLWKKYWHICTEDTFDLIYPNLANKPFKGAMVRNLTSGESLVLLVSGDQLFSKLKEAKGKFKYHPSGNFEITGLRLKYQRGYNNTNGDEMYDFIFHTTDTNEETITIVTLSASSQDIVEIKKIIPQLFKDTASSK